MARRERTRAGYNNPKRAKRSSVVTMIEAIMLALTIFLGVLLLCAYLAQYINPTTTWIFSFAGLIAPILYILNILMALYWIVRWRLIALIPFAVIMLGWNGLSLFFQPTFNIDYGNKSDKSTIVMSYNVMGFLYEADNGRMLSSMDYIIPFIKEQKPDILCLQEFQSKSQEHKQMIDTLIGMRHNVVDYRLKNSGGGGWGVAIYSVYPIIAHGAIGRPNSNNSTLWADIVVKRDTIRIFNNHLQTTSVNESDRQYIVNQEFIRNTENRYRRVRSIAAKLKNNYIRRASQVELLTPAITSSPYRVVVCGDFNDTPMSYVYRQMRGKLRDSFVEKGKGINTNTYKGLFNIFRIDYILHSTEIKTNHYDTPSNDYSDHKAVVVGITI